MVWNLSELFADADAFAAHQKRTAASDWGEQSHGIARDFVKREVSPVLREEQPSDIDGIDSMLREAFGGTDEARLVAGLRAQGDLQFSLVAEAGGVVIGHLGFSPLTGDVSALALAPVAVAPKLQRRGVGAAMIHHALGRAGRTPVIVLGDPEYYGTFGFAPVALNSPYAGPYLQAHGKIAPHSHIRHADAFGQL